MQWDIFCRVVDNHGDIGVCWRLAADLATRGEAIRLHVDDASALGWMAPCGHAGVSVLHWADADCGCDSDIAAISGVGSAPCEVVVEAFGCELPTSVRRRLFESARPPVWINLEYLSAEPFAEASHGLRSPQFDGARRRRDKWFFFPGFSERAGGLILEPDVLARRSAFDREAWLLAHAGGRRPGERVVSLFCYANDRVEPLLHVLSDAPTLLLAASGGATRQVAAALGPTLAKGCLRAVPVPSLTQTDYDHLLWSSDFNWVRGEDSFVRAQWAGVPFVWQVYAQSDSAHEAKLDAFLTRFLSGAEPALATTVREAFERWNGIDDALPGRPSRACWPAQALSPTVAQSWRSHCLVWRDTLALQPDLTTRLIEFAIEKR